MPTYKNQAATPCDATTRLNRSIDRVGCKESFEFAHCDQDMAKCTASRDFSTLNLSAQAHLTDPKQLRCVLQLHGERLHWLAFFHE